MKVGKLQVQVTILRGQVELRNSSGAVTGSRGETLWAAEKEAPKKHALAPSQLPMAPPGK